jgi:hypothetical protein
MSNAVGVGTSRAGAGVRVACLLAAVALGAPLAAQDLSPAKGPSHPVKMFNFLCLNQLPDLDGVKKAAGFGEFAQITGEELEPYRPAVPTQELHAWSFHDGGARYVLTAARAKPDEEFKKKTPAFANSTNVSCSLLFPAGGSKEALFAELVALLKRAPDQSWEDGQMHVRSWTNQNARLLSHIYYYAPAADGPTGVLSASIFVKD